MYSLLLSYVFYAATRGVNGARTQAHLPLAHGLPPAPSSPQSAVFKGDAPVVYAFPVDLGGSRQDVISAATHDPNVFPQPFREWDVNHIQGPSVLDCPDGFVLTSDNTCVFVEFRKPEESCPYGSFREKGGTACVQVDSVPPDRTCPAGFEYFMRGCIRRTQIPPMLTCPTGYQQLDNMCYSVSSVPPHRRCPGTSLLVENGSQMPVCRKEILAPVSYRCPTDFTIEIDPLTTSSSTYVTHLDATTLADARPKCVAEAEVELEHVCATGFSLMSAEDYLGIPDSDALQLSRLGSRGLYCAKAAEYEGVLTCPPGFELVWTAADETAALSDPYRGARCRPTLAFRTMKLPPLKFDNGAVSRASEAAANTELRVLKNGGVWTVFSEGEASEARLNNSQVMVPLSLAVSSSPFRNTKATVPYPRARAPERILSARKLDDGFAPTINFARQSCRMADVQTLLWKEVPTFPSTYPAASSSLNNSPFSNVMEELQRATDQLVTSIQGPKQYRPFCREVQDMVPDYVCPVGSVFTCETGPLPPMAVESVGDEDAASATAATSDNTTKKEENGAEDEVEAKVTVKSSPSKKKSSSKSSSSSGSRPAPKRMLGRASKLASKLHIITPPMAAAPPPPSPVTVVEPSGYLGAAPAVLGGDKMRTLTPSYSSADIQACFEQPDHRPTCSRSKRIVEAEAFCESPEQQLAVHLVEQGDSITKVAACKEVVDEEPYLECPFGVGNVADHNGRCDVLLAAPLAAVCPEGYTKGSQEKSAVSSLLGDPKKLFAKKGVFPPMSDVDTAGICELVEYADYQITCPHGYRRERAKNTAMACVAEKLLPPSILCPPGYMPVDGLGPDELRLDNHKACMKQVVVAPTVISFPDERSPPSGAVTGGASATACVLTKDKRLSCGVERKYHGMIDYEKQRAFGDSFKAKMDKKTRQHIDKHSN